jgi:outer membrane protein OmpA-like peptidoglycan-associated protein
MTIKERWDFSFQLAATCAALFMSGAALSQTVSGAQPNPEPDPPFYSGAYIAPMASYVEPVSKNALDSGFGGILNGGYRQGMFSLEGGLFYTQMGGDGDPTFQGFSISGLLFPFKQLANLYALIGAGGIETEKYADRDGSFSRTFGHGGLGYIFPLQIGNYEFAIRAEALYRYGRREKRLNAAETDLDAPRNFEEVVANLGLQLPLGLKAPPPPPTQATVVPPVAICADGQDNDGDSLVDFPNDPGCTAADDVDETDPPQCSDGKDNDGDGQIDFPADKGCAAAEDNDETDPCKTPEPGEKISLKGCGTGDVIVLRGVNFDFDKARLTPNAKSILDGVAEELKAYPGIQVELSGHTDALGSDSYNQRLSERRAASVKSYLTDAGVDPGRMTTVGHGESQPVADNETEEGREHNRRVELKVTASVSATTAPSAKTTTGTEALAADAPLDAAPIQPSALPEEPTPASTP